MADKTEKTKSRGSQAELLIRWDRQISDAVMNRRSFSEIMDTGRLFLDHPYAFVDTNLEYIYATKDFSKRLDDNNAYERETGAMDFTVQDLLLEKKFHEAAKETSLFYYYSKDDGHTVLCCNIFLNGKYYARMLLQLKNGQRSVPPDDEALFLFFCRRIENLLVSVQGLLQKQQSDSIHSYLTAFASGQDVPLSMFRKSAENAGFRDSDTFCLIYISFFSDEGWDTQYETTLPYLARTLEVKWTYSCAVPSGKNLVWLVDLNRSEANIKSHSFYQELAFFLRDHICTAGVSSRFIGFESIFYAVKQAWAALDLGRKLQPSLWYYLFDDYRLYYLLKKAEEDIPVQHLKPAALQALEDYDREKNAELCATLRTYLRSNQNDSLTAEQLHIHRSTLYRRLERINRLTGLRLDHPDTVLELLLVWKMAGE